MLAVILKGHCLFLTGKWSDIVHGKSQIYRCRYVCLCFHHYSNPQPSPVFSPFQNPKKQNIQKTTRVGEHASMHCVGMSSAEQPLPPHTPCSLMRFVAYTIQFPTRIVGSYMMYLYSWSQIIYICFRQGFLCRSEHVLYPFQHLPSQSG